MQHPLISDVTLLCGLLSGTVECTVCVGGSEKSLAFPSRQFRTYDKASKTCLVTAFCYSPKDGTMFFFPRYFCCELVPFGWLNLPHAPFNCDVSHYFRLLPCLMKLTNHLFPAIQRFQAASALLRTHWVAPLCGICSQLPNPCHQCV